MKITLEKPHFRTENSPKETKPPKTKCWFGVKCSFLKKGKSLLHCQQKLSKLLAKPTHIPKPELGHG